MEDSYKIGLIGFGYWGKIIYNNLINLGYSNIIVCEKKLDDPKKVLKAENIITDYKEIKECNAVFVTVTTDSHFEICSYFLQKKIDVFCEKPLTITLKETETLYNLANQNKCKLFVDWVFTFNSQVEKLKEIYQKGIYGKLRSVTMNRLNMGPVRYDVSAKYDLSSHDISILLYILDELPEKSKWINYKRNRESIQNDSCIGLLQFKETNAQIITSWHYGQKDRDCIFEFEKEIIIWDDIIQILKIKSLNEDIKVDDTTSPLVKSINTFLTNNSFNYIYQEELTKKITKILENDN